MSLIPFRLIFILAGIILGLGLVIGVLHFNKNEYKCLDGKHFYGDWIVTMAFGKFELRQKPWGCPEDNRYNPREFKKLWQTDLSPS